MMMVINNFFNFFKCVLISKMNNINYFKIVVSNKSDMLFSTDEIKEEIDEDTNANNNHNLNCNQYNDDNTIEEINNDQR